MSKRRYIISEASKMVEVESHVLRYWEEELDLKIPRNEMGHRYYLGENITTLQLIKKLKEQGFQLRAIKMVLPDMKNITTLDNKGMTKLREEMNEKALRMEEEEKDKGNDRTNKTHTSSESSLKIHMFPSNYKKDKPHSENNELKSLKKNEIVKAGETMSVETPEKMIQFKTIMKGIMKEAVEEQTVEMTEKITTRVIKEMDYIMRMQEEQSDERFKQLEAVITGVDVSKKQIAATKRAKKKGLFARKKSVT